jgi:hypothetical protein
MTRSGLGERPFEQCPVMGVMLLRSNLVASGVKWTSITGEDRLGSGLLLE